LTRQPKSFTHYCLEFLLPSFISMLNANCLYYSTQAGFGGGSGGVEDGVGGGGEGGVSGEGDGGGINEGGEGGVGSLGEGGEGGERGGW
jgi:hypothetical protein